MLEQVDVERDESIRQEDEALPPNPDNDLDPTGHREEPAAARCVYCGEGMARDVLPRFSRGYGIAVLIAGLLLALFMSLLLGLPMVVIGAYMGAASRPVWICRACGAVVDRFGS